MQEHSVAYVLVTFLALVVASEARQAGAQQVEGDALKQRVMADLPGALSRLEAMYSQVSVSGTSTRERGPANTSKRTPAPSDGSRRPVTEKPLAGDLESTSSHHVVLQANHALKKVHNTVIFDKYYDNETHSMRDSPPTPLKPAKYVICLGRDCSFRLRWDNDIPILMSYGAANDEETNDAVGFWHHHFIEVLSGFSGGHRMSEIMALPSFSVTKVSPTPGQRGPDSLAKTSLIPDSVIARARLGPTRRRGSKPYLGLSPQEGDSGDLGKEEST
jgi:hypothetical protein